MKVQKINYSLKGLPLKVTRLAYSLTTIFTVKEQSPETVKIITGGVPLSVTHNEFEKALLDLKVQMVSEIKFENKAISMMHGKSPRSDVKKLNFVEAILDFWRPSWIDNGYLISLYSVYGNNHLYQLWFFYHKVNGRYTNCHILPFFHNADRK